LALEVGTGAGNESWGSNRTYLKNHQAAGIQPENA